MQTPPLLLKENIIAPPKLSNEESHPECPSGLPGHCRASAPAECRGHIVSLLPTVGVCPLASWPCCRGCLLCYSDLCPNRQLGLGKKIEIQAKAGIEGLLGVWSVKGKAAPGSQ